MSINREDSEVEAVLARERNGSGQFNPTPNQIEANIISHQIKELTPTPSPNYYVFHQHRIDTSNTGERINELRDRLEALSAE